MGISRHHFTGSVQSRYSLARAAPDSCLSVQVSGESHGRHLLALRYCPRLSSLSVVATSICRPYPTHPLPGRAHVLLACRSTCRKGPTGQPSPAVDIVFVETSLGDRSDRASTIRSWGWCCRGMGEWRMYEAAPCDLPLRSGLRERLVAAGSGIQVILSSLPGK